MPSAGISPIVKDFLAVVDIERTAARNIVVEMKVKTSTTQGSPNGRRTHIMLPDHVVCGALICVRHGAGSIAYPSSRPQMLPSPSSSPAAPHRGQRETLHNQTNTYACSTPTSKRQIKADFSLPTPPKFDDASKRVRSSDGPSSRKRIRLSLHTDALSEESEGESEDGDVKMEGIEMLRFRARTSLSYCRNWQARISSNTFGRGLPQRS